MRAVFGDPGSRIRPIFCADEKRLQLGYNSGLPEVHRLGATDE